MAIAAVVFHHLNTYTLTTIMAGATTAPWEAALSRFFFAGHYGVQLFFVLSGFLLAVPFAKWRLGLGERPSLKSYYLRRLTRLEPPYVVAMLMFYLGTLLAVHTAGPSLLPNLLATLVYQHNLIFGGMSKIVSVAWSLEIEVQFYLLAPALAVVYSLRPVWVRRGVILAVMIGAPLLRAYLPWYWRRHYNCLPWHIEFFAAGFLLADVWLVSWQEKPWRRWQWDVVSVAGWTAALGLMLTDRFPVLMAPAVLVAYFGAFRGTVSSWIFRQPLLIIPGGMCYSIYLLHTGVINGTGVIAERLLVGSSFSSRFLSQAVMAVPAILVACGIYFVFLERPCMNPNWPRAVVGRLRGLIK